MFFCIQNREGKFGKKFLLDDKSRGGGPPQYEIIQTTKEDTRPHYTFDILVSRERGASYRNFDPMSLKPLFVEIGGGVLNKFKI